MQRCLVTYCTLVSSLKSLISSTTQALQDILSCPAVPQEERGHTGIYEDEVFGVQDANDVLRVLLVDRYPRIT